MVKREPAKEKKNESTRFKDKQQCLNRSRYYCASTKKKFREEQKIKGMGENKEAKHCHSSVESIQLGNIAYNFLQEMPFFK